MKGKLIVIEGLDGSGKATQAKLLADTLAEQGKNVRTVPQRIQIRKQTGHLTIDRIRSRMEHLAFQSIYQVNNTIKMRNYRHRVTSFIIALFFSLFNVSY